MSEETVAVSDDGLEGNVTVKKDRFKYVMIPSLKDMSIVTIITAIYKQNDIREIIQQYSERKVMKETEQLLHQKWLLLPLPNRLKNISSNFYKLVTLQGNHMINSRRLMIDFVACKCGFDFRIPLEYFDCLCFKMDGTIDKLKTFNSMHERGYPKYDIFVAACHLCSYELVSKSWDKGLSDFPDCPLIKYWVYFLVNNKFPDYQPIVDENLEFNFDEIFEYSLGTVYFNFAAIEYFYPVLTINRETSYCMKRLIMTAFDAVANCTRRELSQMKVECLNIAFFLLAKMIDGEQQMQLLQYYFKEFIFPLLSNVLYQKFLEPVCQLVRNSLNPDDTVKISLIVLRALGKGNNLGIKLFIEIWNRSSKRVKNSIVNELIELLSYYDYDFQQCEVQFLEIVKMILSGCSIKIKRKCMRLLVEYNSGICNLLKDINNLNVIDTFIRDVFLSELEITCYKPYFFRKCIPILLRYWVQFDDYDSADKFLGWRFASQREMDDYKRSLKFRSEVIDVIGIYISEYEKLDKLMNWWSNSETEIKEFKNFLAYNADFFFAEFGLFLKFVDWCFVGRKKDVKRFKKFKSKFEKLKNDIRRIELNDFEYVNELLNWYLSPKKIQLFKIKHFTSRYLTDILKNMVFNKLSADRNNSEFPSICEMGENLALWYGKVGLERIRKLKNRIRKIKKVEEHIRSPEFPSIFKSLVDNFILSLKLNHKPT